MPNPTTGKIGITELPRSEFGPSGFAVQTYDLDVGVSAAGQAGVTPDNIGLTVWNATGSDIAAGKLVYISGYNATHSMPQITLATGITPNTLAAFVTLGIIVNGTSGLVGKHYSLTGQNTNAAGAAGDAVYLSTAGAYDVTSPGTAVAFVQNVGRVVVKSATVGVVDFDLLAAPLIGAVYIDQRTFVPTTIPTTGGAEILFRVPINAGTLLNFAVFAKDALATDNTNFIQWGAVNHGHVDGTGTTQMLDQASGHSSTKTTGGNALVAYASTSMVPSATPGNLVVAFGDIIAFTATCNGTLANTVTEAVVQMRLLPASA